MLAGAIDRSAMALPSPAKVFAVAVTVQVVVVLPAGMTSGLEQDVVYREFAAGEMRLTLSPEVPAGMSEVTVQVLI